MTLASICISVARDLGIDEPTAPIIGSRLPAAKRLVAQAHRALYSLVRRADFAPLVIEYEFTASGASDYPLPPDFLSMINDTAWERTRYWAMRGSLSPQQWQRYRSSIYGRATIWRRWRIRVASGAAVGTATTFSIDPHVAATDHTSQFVFEYRSAWAIRHPDGTMGSDWAFDDDHCILSDELIVLGTRWRVLRRMGLPYDEEKEEYDREVDKMVARSGGMSTLNLVPFQREDFIGQYSLGAFPPTAPAPHEALPFDVARVIAPMERPDWRPPPDWSGPPPLAPRPPLLAPRHPPPAAVSEAERARELLARAPLVEPPPRPPVRRLRTRHQPPPGPPGPPGPPALVPAAAPSAAEPGTRPILVPAAAPPASEPGRHPVAARPAPPAPEPGTPHPAAPPPPRPEPSQGPPERQGWLELGGRSPPGPGPLEPRLPELPLPPGT